MQKINVVQVRQEEAFLFTGLVLLINITPTYAKKIRNPAIFLVIKSFFVDEFSASTPSNKFLLQPTRFTAY